MPYPIKDRWPLICVLTLLIIAKIPYLLYPYYWDESTPYVPAILEMYKHGISLLPTALPPDLSRGHPLFFHSIAALWIHVFGSSCKSLHGFALFISILFLITIFETGYRFFNKRVAVISLLLIATNVFFYVQSSFVLPEILVAFLSFLSLYLYAKEKYLYATLSLTALFLTKESGMIAGFIISMDAIVALFNTSEKIKTRLLKFIPVTVACIAIGSFLLVQKHYRGWYVFPLHTDLVLNKWIPIWYRFRTCSIKTTFCTGYDYIIFSLLVLFAIIAIIKNRKIQYLPLLFIIIPIALAYYFIDDGRAEMFSGIEIFGFIAFIVFYVVALFSFAKAKYYDNPLQRKFILLVGFFILAYVLFSSVACFCARYELASIVPTLFLLAVLFDMLIKQSYQILYYPLLIIILTAGIFSFKNDNGYGDVHLGYKYGVKTQLAVVEYMERSNFYDKHIAIGSYLERAHLTNRSTGFLSNERNFKYVTSDIDSNTDLVIFDSLEPDMRYDTLVKGSTFELVYHIEMHGVWADVFRRRH